LDWTLRRLEPDQARPTFDCGVADLNEFFARDSIEGGKQLLSVTYVAEIASEAAAFFSVSNDAVRKTDPSRSLWDRLLRQVPREKRYSSMPAVKIGRLATCLTRQRGGIGTELLDYIKVWFTHGNKTGCRFIIVDANNNPETIRFYRRNGFEFLLSGYEKDATRLMYFDLITFAPG
jgi:GNAT superfamily N-acetyltransferase